MKIVFLGRVLEAESTPHALNTLSLYLCEFEHGRGVPSTRTQQNLHV